MFFSSESHTKENTVGQSTNLPSDEWMLLKAADSAECS